MQLPKARTAELVEQETDKKLLIYDLQTNKAYMLNETSKNVFRACDGITSFNELSHKYQYTDDLIYLTLDELKKNNLMEGDYTSPFGGMKRREVIKKVGLASMLALPVISMLIAPSAAMAASGGCVAPNAGGAPGGSSTTMSGNVATLKASCMSCCYRDYDPRTQTGTCCNNCGEARCQ